MKICGAKYAFCAYGISCEIREPEPRHWYVSRFFHCPRPSVIIYCRRPSVTISFSPSVIQAQDSPCNYALQCQNLYDDPHEYEEQQKGSGEHIEGRRIHKPSKFNGSIGKSTLEKSNVRKPPENPEKPAYLPTEIPQTTPTS